MCGMSGTAEISWTTDHIDRVEQADLPTQERGGYVEEDVRRQLARIVALMHAHQPVPPINTGALRRSKLRPGYAPGPVEALFANVAQWQQHLHRDGDTGSPATPASARGRQAPPDEPEKLKWTRQQQVWVREMEFPSARRHAYEVSEVDDFLDSVLVAMAKGEPLPDVHSAQFYMTRMARSGYECAAVDHFLDQVARLRPAL